jgi:hypothetical protein
MKGSFIIHISGTNASGKSTLCAELNKLPGVICFDTDEFIQSDEDRDKIRKNPNPNLVRNEMFTLAFQTHIQNNFYKYRVIVFTGLLDHASPDGVYFEEILFDRLFYLDVALHIVLKRTYERYVTFLSDWNFLEGVMTNQHIIPSSEQVIKAFYETRKYHVDLNQYEPKTAREIIYEIQKM